MQLSGTERKVNIYISIISFAHKNTHRISLLRNNKQRLKSTTTTKIVVLRKVSAMYSLNIN